MIAARYHVPKGSHPKFAYFPVVVSMRRRRLLYESLRKKVLAPTARDKTSIVDRTCVITIVSDPYSRMRSVRLLFSIP